MTKVTRKRHLVKAISYRIIGTITTMCTGWYITGDIMSGVKIGVIESLLKISIYYGHERVWLKINFGLNNERKN
jgi:uncharacterized membrane protein